MRLLVAAAALTTLSAPCLAQLSVTRTPSIATSDLGKVAEGTAATAFTVEPWSSSVSRSPDTSSGHLRFDSTALSPPSVTVSCTSSTCVGSSNQVQIRIMTSSSNARITVNQWTAGALNYVSGYQTVAPSGTNNMVWTVQFNSTSSSVTFNIGQTMTIAQTGSSNNLDVVYRVTAGVHTAPTSGGVTGTIRTIMYRAISIAKNTDLIFGQVKRPPSGTGHVIIDPTLSTNPRSVDGGVVLINDPSATRAKFTTTGEGASAITVSLPSSVILYGSRGGQMTLVPTGSGTGGTTLSGTAGAAGSKISYVGGSLAIDSNDPTGSYTGTLTVTSTYN
ncbi:DUF4402 domain-containing protein [Sphingomonas crusticola]|uniref:DUF4402 domain-containing protein n=1 Tax=Sphingomonas crusticola TaxID=1697973 RepID=UPI0013C37185|nr:DUF4402 domain-containing protein [Sphingomonas crusticola]